MTAGTHLLVLDTATRWPTVALADTDGELLGTRQWESRHRHGEQLLEEIEELLTAERAQVSDLSGVVVGTGPGSFTGLRIGLATAKVLAYSLALPLAGVQTSHALALAAVGDGDQTADVALVLPAGAADFYLCRLDVTGGTGGTDVAGGSVRDTEPPTLLAGADSILGATGGSLLVAVDVAADAVTADGRERGERAVGGLAEALARLGAAALAHGRADDVATLVPAYVALPRGIRQQAEEIEWLPDLR